MDFEYFFVQILDNLHEVDGVKVCSLKFSLCKTDAERITYVLGMKEVRNRLEELQRLVQEKIPTTPKSQNLSTSHRMQGNTHYQKKQNSNALLSYNQSLFVGEGEALSLAYANRSAVFHDMADWLHSLRDIQLAIDHGYPKRLEHKLRERQGNCWLKLGNVKQAYISFIQARDLLISSVDTDQGKLAGIMSKLKDLGDVNGQVSKTLSAKEIERHVMETRRQPPPLNKPRNNLLPSASTSVDLVDRSGRGRCLVATEDLEIGSTIIVEKAFASTLLEEFREFHCHHCLQWTPGPVPCHQCSQVAFCSTVCKDEAWATYHPHECGLADVLHATNLGDTALLALRTVLKVDRQTLVDAQDEAPPGCAYDSTDYGTIHRLVGNTTLRSVADLFQRAVTAVYLVKLVSGPAEVDKVLATAVLRLRQSYPCNAHEVCYMALPPPSISAQLANVHLKEVGAAAMPVLSLINHSCNPNITRVCYGDVMAVVVVRPIRRGEEILDNYGHHYALEPRWERHKNLNRQYYFLCNCVACVEDWPSHDECPKMSTRSDISVPFNEDLQKFMVLPCYPNDPEHLARWAKKFISYLKSIDADASIVKPVNEYNCAQEALKHCLALSASLTRCLDSETIIN